MAGRGDHGGAALVADVGPVSFDAVTVTRNVLPTSLEEPRYWAEVAPAIEAQFAPAVSHRFHWYA